MGSLGVTAAVANAKRIRVAVLLDCGVPPGRCERLREKALDGQRSVRTTAPFKLSVPKRMTAWAASRYWMLPSCAPV